MCKVSVKWLPKPNNWSEVVVMKLYTYISYEYEKDGIKCHKILHGKCMNILDVATYTNGGITERKKSKLHIPHNTKSTCTTTYGKPVTSFSMYMCKDTFKRIVYTTI